MPYKALEKMQEQIGFAMARLGYWGGERQSLNQAYGALRDILHFERCPHAERSARWVTVPLDTMEKIDEWVDRAREGRGDYSKSIINEVRFSREKQELERVRFTIQEMLFKASL